MFDFTDEEMDYLSDLAEEYGVDEETVFMLADIMPNELYDGLLCDLEDLEMWGY